MNSKQAFASFNGDLEAYYVWKGQTKHNDPEWFRDQLERIRQAKRVKAST